jgi:hypothetical protein
VGAGAVVVRAADVVTLSYQQLLVCPTAGSPKTAFEQATLPSATRIGFVILIAVPYMTRRRPEKVQVLNSEEQ